MADPVLGTWWSTPPSPPVTSEFTTPGDLRRAQIMAQTGWDIEHPWREFARQLLTYIPMAAPMGRSPLGTRVMDDTGWAMRTPTAITGGGRPALDAMPLNDWFRLHAMYGAQRGPLRDIYANSIDSMLNHPTAFDRGPNMQLMQDMRGARVTPQDFGLYGPSSPGNANLPGGPMFRLIPGGRTPSGLMESP